MYLSINQPTQAYPYEHGENVKLEYSSCGARLTRKNDYRDPNKK